MSSSLRQRVSRVIAGGAHAVIDKIEGLAPVAMLEQSVREVESITAEVRTELGLTVANRHVAQRQHVNLNQEHQQLDKSIEQALAVGRDDLVKSAIARQLDIEVQLPILESSLAELGATEGELSGFVDALLGKQREMNQAIADFEASRARTDATSSGADSARGVGQTGARLGLAQAAFDRTYRRQTGLDLSGQHASLEHAAKLRELGDLVRETAINERLAGLKAKP